MRRYELPDIRSVVSPRIAANLSEAIGRPAQQPAYPYLNELMQIGFFSPQDAMQIEQMGQQMYAPLSKAVNNVAGIYQGIGPAMQRGAEGVAQGISQFGRGIGAGMIAAGDSMRENRRMALVEKRQQEALAREEKIKQNQLRAYQSMLTRGVGDPNQIALKMAELGGELPADYTPSPGGSWGGGERTAKVVDIGPDGKPITNLYLLDDNANKRLVGPADTAPETSVNIDQKQESEFNKKYGTTLGEMAGNMVQGAAKAQTHIQQLNALETMMTGVTTGRLDPAKATVGAWAQSVGVDPKQVGIDPALPMTADAMGAISAKLVIDMIGPGGFPANLFTEADREFLMNTFPKMGDLPQAQALKFEVARRLAGRQIELAQEWLVASQSGKPFEQFILEKSQDTKNIFADLVDKAPKQEAPRVKAGQPFWFEGGWHSYSPNGDLVPHRGP